MDNSIFREMKKEKDKLIKEHTEYEKYNFLLKQNIQQLIQSNEKLLLSLKLRFEKFTRLNNQDFSMKTSISDKIQQINIKQIEMSEISEIEKKSIEESINRSEKELNQIKADLKIVQRSDYNVFNEISDLQKKKDKLLKEQKELTNSIKSLKKQHKSNPIFLPYSQQFEQFHENTESSMMLRNQIFKFHKEKVEQERESYKKANSHSFYLEPSKLLKVLSISQTPKSSLSSTENNEYLNKNDTETNSLHPINSSNYSKNNENQNNEQIKDDYKIIKDGNLIIYYNNNRKETDNKNHLKNKHQPKYRRKVLKYQPNSNNIADKSNLTSKEKLQNDNNENLNCDSELQSISFPDTQSEHSDIHELSKKEPKNNIVIDNIRPTNKFAINYPKNEKTSTSTAKKELTPSSSKSGNLSTTNSEFSNQKSLPKLTIESNTKNGVEKHVLISPTNTSRKHDNSANVVLSPINISLEEKTSTNRNSLINIFSSNNNSNTNTSQNTPRLAGICKPSLTHQGSLALSQTLPSTSLRISKPTNDFSTNDSLSNRNQNNNQDKNNLSNKIKKDNENSNTKNDLIKDKINKNDINNDSKNTSFKVKSENNEKLSSLLNQSVNKLIQKDHTFKKIGNNKDESSVDILIEEEEELGEDSAIFINRKSQTKESYIKKSKILSFSLESFDKQMTKSNLELKITDLQKQSIDLETECFQINKRLMKINPGSRSFRRKNRPVLRYEFNLNPLLLIDRNSHISDVRNAQTQSEEDIPDIDQIKNQILQNSSAQSQFVINQHKQELIKLLSSLKFELKVEKMNVSRKKVELNDELKRLKLVDPFLYYKELNIEPEEEVGEELSMKKDTIRIKEKLEKRIDEMKQENENLTYRINDLTFVTNRLQKKLTLMSKEPKFNVRGLCDNLKNDRNIINEILRQTAFVGIETKHIENNINKFNENYGTKNINLLVETTEKMKQNLNSLKNRFNTLRAVKEKRSIVLTSENELKSLRLQQQDILNTIDVTKMRIFGTISKIGKQLRSISDFNIRVPTPPSVLNIQEEDE